MTDELAPCAPAALRPRDLPWRVAGVLGMAAFALAPLAAVHAQQLWARPHYQFFPLLLPGAAALALARMRGLGTLQAGSALPAVLLGVLAWAVLALAVVLGSAVLGATSLLIMLGAVAYTAGGFRLLRALLPALLLLGLAVRFPGNLDGKLLMALQSLTTRCSSRLLDLLGVYHVLAGNVVEVDGRRLLVEEACSGVNSLFVVLAAVLFWVLWTRRPLLHAVLLLAAGAAWVLLANVARVTAITYLSTRGWDLSEGWAHEAAGFVACLAAVLLTWSTDELFLFLRRPTLPSRDPFTAPRSAPTRPTAGPGLSLPDLRRTWLCSPVAAALFAVLLLAQLGELLAAPAPAPAEGVPPAVLESFRAEDMPARWGQWQREGFGREDRNPGSNYGEHTLAWKYQWGHNAAGLALDYPFTDWHELTVCYRSQGWQIQGQSLGAGPGLVVTDLLKPGCRCGHLIFCELDGRGVPLPPHLEATPGILYHRGGALEHWHAVLSGEPLAPPVPLPVYQVQLLVETFIPLTPEERQAAGQFFLQGLETIRQRCFPSGAPGREAQP